MADDITLNAGSGGATVAADLISGVYYPRSKIIIGVDGTNSGDVSASNPLPISDASGSITVDNGGTFAVQAVCTNAGTFSVQASAIVPGTGETNLGKAEDAAHSSGDVGVMALSVRQNSAAALAGSDSDYQPLITDGNGLLYVNVGNTVAVSTVSTVGTITNVVHIDDNSGSITVDNGGTFAVQATIASGATSIAKAEDVASADADVGIPAMAVRKATPANTSGTDGDYEFLQVSAGRLWASAVIDTALPAGTNAIGKLAANSGVTIGAVEIASAQTLATVTTVSTVTAVTAITNALPAGTNLLGKTVASPDTDTIYQGTTALTTKRAKISCASSGENTLVALVSAHKIRVHSIALFAVGTAVSIYFKDGASGTANFADGTNPIPLDKSGAAGAGGFVLPFNPAGWFDTASGAALILNLSGAQAVAGGLQYTEVT